MAKKKESFILTVEPDPKIKGLYRLVLEEPNHSGKTVYGGGYQLSGALAKASKVAFALSELTPR